MTPGTKMPNFKMMDSEVEALVAYMSSLGGGTFTAEAPRLFEDNCASCTSSREWARKSGRTCRISARAGTRISSRLTSKTLSN